MADTPKFVAQRLTEWLTCVALGSCALPHGALLYGLSFGMTDAASDTHESFRDSTDGSVLDASDGGDSEMDVTDADWVNVFDASDALGMDTSSDVSTFKDASSADSTQADASLDATPTDTLRPAFRTDPADTRILPVHGGTGGTPYTLACNPGEVAVGIVGRSGTFIDAIGLRCASLQPDGSPTATVRDTGLVGVAGGVPFSDRCPAGQAVMGLYGSIGTEGYQLGIHCARVTDWITGGMYTSLPSHGIPGSNSMPYDDLCPIGYVLASLSGRAGSVVDDAIQGQCVRVLR